MKTIEFGIEGEYPSDAFPLHHCRVDRISRRESRIAEDNLFCPFDRGMVDRENLVYKSQKHVEDSLNRIRALDQSVTVQNFLQHLGVSHKALSIAD